MTVRIYVDAENLQDGTYTWAAAGGTADAITATYSPTLSTLVDGQMCYVRATAANATTTPTFSPDSITAHTITKSGGRALAIGDIAGSGHELVLRYNLANTHWELLNPATAQLDATFNKPVASVITSLPVSPSDGDRYLVAHSGTSGALIGQEDQIVERANGQWVYSGAAVVGQKAILTSGRELIRGPHLWIPRRVLLTNIEARARVVDANITCTTGSKTIDFADAGFGAPDFSSLDVGSKYRHQDFVTTITAVNSASEIVVNDFPPGVLTADHQLAIVGLVDTDAFQAAIDEAENQGINYLQLPASGLLVDGPLTWAVGAYSNKADYNAPFTIAGAGKDATVIYTIGDGTLFACDTIAGAKISCVALREFGAYRIGTKGTSVGVDLDTVNNGIVEDASWRGFHQAIVGGRNAQMNYVSIRRNYIRESDECITFSGDGAAPSCEGNSAVENTFDSFYTSGFKIDCVAGTVGNVVSSSASLNKAFNGQSGSIAFVYAGSGGRFIDNKADATCQDNGGSNFTLLSGVSQHNYVDCPIHAGDATNFTYTDTSSTLVDPHNEKLYLGNIVIQDFKSKGISDEATSEQIVIQDGETVIGGGSAEAAFTLHSSTPTNGLAAAFSNGADCNIILPLTDAAAGTKRSGIGSGTSTDFCLYSNNVVRVTIDATSGNALFAEGIGVGNSASATAVGTVVKKIEVFDASGSSLGFIPVYSSIT